MASAGSPHAFSIDRMSKVTSDSQRESRSSKPLRYESGTSSSGRSSAVGIVASPTRIGITRTESFLRAVTISTRR